MKKIVKANEREREKRKEKEEMRKQAIKREVRETNG